MNDDWIDDPDAQEWVRNVLDNLVPKLADSALTVSLVPEGPTDVKFAVELGMSIMFDLPIILAVKPGVEIPDHLRRVADDIVDISDPANLAKALDRMMAKIDKKGNQRDRLGADGGVSPDPAGAEEDH